MGRTSMGLPDRPSPDDSLWPADDAWWAPACPRPAPRHPHARATPSSPTLDRPRCLPRRPVADQRSGRHSGCRLTAPSVPRPDSLPVPKLDVTRRCGRGGNQASTILLGLAQNAPAWLISAVVHTSPADYPGIVPGRGRTQTRNRAPGHQPQRCRPIQGSRSTIRPFAVRPALK